MEEYTDFNGSGYSAIEDMIGQDNSTVFPFDTHYLRTLKIFHDVIVMFTAGSAMLAIGCDITINKIKEHLKLPKAAVLGLSCQFILMPFLGYVVVNLLKMDPLNAAGVIILCSAPGGGYSNLLSYLTNSDVSLSALMTTLSSMISLGITPLNLWIYGRFLEEMNIVMPYEKITISLVVLQGVLVCGLIIRCKFIKIAEYITKIGVGVSVCLLLCRQIIAIMIKPTFYLELHWKIYAACCIIPSVGLVIPYIIALLMRENVKIARTLALETAIQSIGTSFTIVFVSFNKDVIWEVQQYIALYSDVTCTGFLGGVLICHGVTRTISKFRVEHKLVTNKLLVEEERQALQSIN